MTPDTTVYMVAGFVVILGGIVVYILSMVLRNRQLEKLVRELEDMEKDL